MKSALVLVTALLATAGLAWAQAPAEEIAPPGEAGPAASTAAFLEPIEGGGCTLPDLAGLSEEEIVAAALEAGFEIAPVEAQPPACPVTFNCSSITNCGAGAVCSVSNLGQCCTSAGGPVLCCISGTIRVQRCPCRCTGNPCALSCVNSTDVKWRCQ